MTYTFENCPPLATNMIAIKLEDGSFLCSVVHIKDQLGLWKISKVEELQNLIEALPIFSSPYAAQIEEEAIAYAHKIPIKEGQTEAIRQMACVQLNDTPIPLEAAQGILKDIQKCYAWSASDVFVWNKSVMDTASQKQKVISRQTRMDQFPQNIQKHIEESDRIGLMQLKGLLSGVPSLYQKDYQKVKFVGNLRQILSSSMKSLWDHENVLIKKAQTEKNLRDLIKRRTLLKLSKNPAQSFYCINLWVEGFDINDNSGGVVSTGGPQSGKMSILIPMSGFFVEKLNAQGVSEEAPAYQRALQRAHDAVDKLQETISGSKNSSEFNVSDVIQRANKSTVITQDIWDLTSVLEVSDTGVCTVGRPLHLSIEVSPRSFTSTECWDGAAVMKWIDKEKQLNRAFASIVDFAKKHDALLCIDRNGASDWVKDRQTAFGFNPLLKSQWETYQLRQIVGAVDASAQAASKSIGTQRV